MLDEMPMNYTQFYTGLLRPLVDKIGKIDKETMISIVGFDAGGPLNFCTIGRDIKSDLITYVSCELAVRNEQKPNSTGRYELLTSCDDEQWVRSIITKIGRMTLDDVFDDGHTMDISNWADNVNGEIIIQGILFKRECLSSLNGKRFGILRCIGITRPEMEYSQVMGSSELIKMLIKENIYPNTFINRKSVV